MTKFKHYNLKTIEDISKMVNDKNVMNFLTDFNECMIRWVQAKKKHKLSARKVFMSGMEWIDDWEHKIIIKKSK